MRDSKSKTPFKSLDLPFSLHYLRQSQEHPRAQKEHAFHPIIRRRNKQERSQATVLLRVLR